MNRRVCGFSRPLVGGLLLAGVLLMPDVARGQTATPAPTPSLRQTSGCAEFYPQWIKRELPDTPDNEKRALACLNMSPFDAPGCPQLIHKVNNERGAGIPMTLKEHSGLVVCAQSNPRNQQKFVGPPAGGWSHGRVYTNKLPLPPSAQHPTPAATPEPPATELQPPPGAAPRSLTSRSAPLSSTGPVPLFGEFAGGDMQASPTASPSPVPQGQPPDVS